MGIEENMRTPNCQFCKLLAQKLLKRGIRTELGLVKTNNKDAVRRYYRHAAILGNRQAQVFLAYYYASDLGPHCNRRLALAWFKRAARAGEELCSLVSSENNIGAEEQIRHFKMLISA